jgi:hypothetical protein
MPAINNFVSLAGAMSKGEAWTSLFSSRSKAEAIKNLFGPNDMKRFKMMKQNYKKINISFDKTTVEMKNRDIVDIYFGAKKIEYTDPKGGRQQMTYYDGLQKIIADLNASKPQLEAVEKSMGQKFEKTQMNQTFAHLPAGVQTDVKDAILMISKIIKAIGSIIANIQKDMHTIQSSTNKILKQRGVKPVNNVP